MKAQRSAPTPPGTVSGGAFDELPGAPWKKPPEENYVGFAIPAMSAMKNYSEDEVGEATFKAGNLELTVRVVGMIEDLTGRPVRIFQFIAEEFEALVLFPTDMADIHLSFRGNAAALTDAAKLLRAVGDNAMLNNMPGPVH